MQGRGVGKRMRPIPSRRRDKTRVPQLPAGPWWPQGGDTVLSRGSDLQMNDSGSLWAGLHPSPRESPNPAEPPQTRSCPMGQQQISPGQKCNARKVLLPLTDPLNCLLGFSMVSAGLQPGQSQPCSLAWSHSQLPNARRQRCHQNIPELVLSGVNNVV